MGNQKMKREKVLERAKIKFFSIIYILIDVLLTFFFYLINSFSFNLSNLNILADWRMEMLGFWDTTFDNQIKNK